MRYRVPAFATGLALGIAFGLISGAEAAAQQPSVPKWSVHEITLRADGSYAGPFDGPGGTATFTGPGGRKKTVRGFWDGGKEFKIRFTPTAEGQWTYTTRSADAGLGGKSGSFRCTAPRSGSHGFLRRDETYRYHFAWDDGTRYFLCGNTYYGLLDRGEKDWKQTIDGTKSRGMNKIRFHGPRDGKEGVTLERLRKLDQVVRYMGAQGIVADLLVFSSGSFQETEAEDEDYLRYILARYAAYPNVAWTLVNEWNYRPKPRAYWNRMGRLVRAEDPWSREANAPRALSVHQQTRIDFQFFDETWMSHAIIQLGVRNGQPVTQDDELKYKGAPTQARMRYGDDWGNAGIVYNLGHNMPVVNDEYGYIGEPEDKSAGKDKDGNGVRLSRDKHRRILWGIYAAGGYGSAGDKYDYPDAGRPYKTGHWKDPAEYRDIQHLVEFFTTKGVEYWKMSSHNKLATAGERVYVLAEPRRQYVVYAAIGGKFSLDLAPGSYQTRRFDPRTGEDAALGAVEGGGVRSFTLPDQQDWVLYLRADDQATA